MEITKETTKQIKDKSYELWLAGIGAFSAIEEESEKFIKEGEKLYKKFIEKGKDLEKKGQKIEQKAIDKIDSIRIFDNVSDFIDEKLNIAFENIGISSHNEVKDLSGKVDKLAESVDILSKKIEQKKTAASAKTKA